jgi:hypothetical protein
MEGMIVLVVVVVGKKMLRWGKRWRVREVGLRGSHGDDRNLEMWGGGE